MNIYKDNTKRSNKIYLEGVRVYKNILYKDRRL